MVAQLPMRRRDGQILGIVRNEESEGREEGRAMEIDWERGRRFSFKLMKTHRRGK